MSQTLHNTAGNERARAGDTILSLQVMRGIAAVAVVVYHAHLMLSRPGAEPIGILATIAANGWLGVNFFFVLSGFIILYAHHRDIGNPSQLPRYIWRRFSRLYPIYWIFLSLYLAGAVAGVGDAEIDWSANHLLSAITLTSLTENPVLPLKLAWTLLFEVTFYAAFAVLIVSARLGRFLLVAWAIGIVVKNILFPAWQFDLLHVWNLYFLSGMAVFAGHRRISNRLGWPILLMGVLILVVFGAILQGGITAADANPGLLALLIVPFPLLLLGGILLERRYSWRPQGALLLLGDASYAIYLVHSAVLSVVVMLDARFVSDGVPRMVVFLIGVVLAIAVGVTAHLLIEKPLLNVLRSFRELAPRFRNPAKRISKSG